MSLGRYATHWKISIVGVFCIEIDSSTQDRVWKIRVLWFRNFSGSVDRIYVGLIRMCVYGLGEEVNHQSRYPRRQVKIDHA